MGRRGEGLEVAPRPQGLQVAPRPQGPVKGRSCTDILCLGLFLAAIIAWAGVSVIGFQVSKTSALGYTEHSMVKVTHSKRVTCAPL